MTGTRWHLFLGLQSDLHQPPDGLRPAWQIILAAAPVVYFLGHVGLDADHNRGPGHRRPLLWKRAIIRCFLHGIMIPRNHVL